MKVILRILPKLAFVSSFHYYEDSDCTNGEHTNNTKADNQRQGGVFRIKKVTINESYRQKQTWLKNNSNNNLLKTIVCFFYYTVKLGYNNFKLTVRFIVLDHLLNTIMISLSIDITYSLHLYLVSVDFLSLWETGSNLHRQTIINIGEFILKSYIRCLL